MVCVAQQKGGVCKTTAVISLSAALALAGHKVLAIDLDPQANLTRGLLDYEALGKDMSMLYSAQAKLVEICQKTAYPNLFLAPTRTGLSKAESVERSLSSFNAIRRELPYMRESFQVVLIDTPPSLGLFTVSALLAASHVLVPVQPTFFCQEGLGDLNATVAMARETNQDLRSVRYFLSLYDKRTVLSQDLVSIIRKNLGEALFESVIRRNVAIEESQYAQKTIFDYAPASSGAMDYQRLAKEVLAWLEKG